MREPQGKNENRILPFLSLKENEFNSI